MLKRPQLAAVFVMMLVATVAQAAPWLDMQQAYGNLGLRLSVDADYAAGFDAPNTALFRDDLAIIAFVLSGDSTMHFPLDSVTIAPDGGTIAYKYAAGGTWNLENLGIEHPDGSIHVGSFHATLGAMEVEPIKDGTALQPVTFAFSKGAFDHETAALLGLRGDSVSGVVGWFFDFNHPEDFGSEEYVITPFGIAYFDVPEPSMMALLGVGLLVGRRRLTRSMRRRG